MATGITIDRDTCVGCGLCQLSCTWGAIRVYLKANVDNARCTDCGVCPDYCPVYAITLNDPPMRQLLPPAEVSCDVAVIGGGISGLSAAALLARRGYRVVLADQAPSLGGRWTSIRYGGMDVPTGAYSIEVGGVLERVFREAGAEFDVLVPSPATYYWYDGRFIDPGSGSGRLRRTFAAVCEDPDEVQRVMGAMRAAFSPGGAPNPCISLCEWLDGVTKHAGIRGVFHSLARATLGTEEVSAAQFFYWLAHVRAEYGYTRKGANKLVRGLAEVVTRHAGEVWTRARATRIEIEDGRATGIVLWRKGQQVTLRPFVVISSIGPAATARLVGHENLPAEYVARMQSRKERYPHIDVHLESEEPLLPLPGTVFPVGVERMCLLLTPTLAVEWGPPGRHMTIAEANARSWDLEAEAKEVLGELDRIIPAWRERANLVMLTLQSGEPWGVFDLDIREPIETPIWNVLNVGDRIMAEEGAPGLPAAAETALKAAALVAERWPLE